jgi:hypothetical protein
MKIVTISRQVGSLGDVIAAITARNLGYKLIGKDQVHERANTCDPEYHDACEVFDTERGPGFFERIFFDSPSYISLFKSLTFEFASEGNVVLVGRGSQLILKDVPGVFRLRTVAPSKVRVERVRVRFGISAEEASEYVRKHDRERRAMYQSIFESDLSDWTQFDMVLNTAKYESGGAAEAVSTAIQKMEEEVAPADLKERLSAMALAKRVELIIRKRLTPAVALHIEASGEPGGALTLTGHVRDKRTKQKAETIAREYPNVSSVVNELKMTELHFGL